MMSAGSPSTPASSANADTDAAKCPTVMGLPSPDEGYHIGATTLPRVTVAVPAPCGPTFRPHQIGGASGGRIAVRTATTKITSSNDLTPMPLPLPAGLDRVRWGSVGSHPFTVWCPAAPGDVMTSSCIRWRAFHLHS